MKTALLLGGALAAMALHASGAEPGPAPDPVVREQLMKIAREKVFFAHQSVGANLIDGLEALARANNVPLRVANVYTAGNVDTPGFGHVLIGENKKPLLKLTGFEQAMGSASASVDIALVKFCYVDFDATTDAKSLFAEYRATLERLRTRHPHTAFVPVTAPLKRIDSGPKVVVMRLFGRPPAGVAENAKRDEFNALLRQEYLGKLTIFDLARAESTGPDGREVSFEWQGRTVPALDAAYTDDGGHLNAAGRLHAAREMVRVLSSVAPATAPATGGRP